MRGRRLVSVQRARIVVRQRSSEFCLSVADIRVGVVCDEPLALRVTGAARRFLVDCQTPDVKLRVTCGDLSRPTAAEKIFDAGALWQLHRDGDQSVFRFTSSAFGPVPFKTARFNLDFTAGEICLHRPYFESRGPVYPLECPLDELVFSNFLANGRGVEIHGCGVIDRSGAGYLFAGESGAGKTTIARLWKKQKAVTILSDDRIVLRALDGQIWMYGTPWHGDEPLAAPRRVALTRVFFLKHAGSHRLTPARGAPAAARLFACSFPPFHSTAGLEFTLGLLDQITSAVPCGELGFAADPTLVAFIRNVARPRRKMIKSAMQNS